MAKAKKYTPSSTTSRKRGRQVKTPSIVDLSSGSEGDGDQSNDGSDSDHDDEGKVVQSTPKVNRNGKRVAPPSGIDNTPSKKSARLIQQIKLEDKDDDKLEPVNTVVKDEPSVKEVAQPPKGGRQATPGPSSVGTHMNDPTSESPPDTDESVVGELDPALAGTYKDLVNIRAAKMISWSALEGTGQSYYTGIVNSVPSLNVPLLFSAVVFKSYKRFANLSRVDPAHVSIGHNGTKYFHRPGTSTPLVFTSVIYVATSDLIEPKLTANTKPTKSISGTLLEVEWERLVGSIGMIIWEREFKGQLFKDNLSFTTAPSSGDTSYRLPKARDNSVFRGKPSAFSFRPGSGQQKTTLSCSDTVPIYDARSLDMDFETALTRIDTLPTMQHELPARSCAVVAYTVNVFNRGGDPMKSLSFNVQWVMRLSDGASNDSA